MIPQRKPNAFTRTGMNNKLTFTLLSFLFKVKCFLWVHIYPDTFVSMLPLYLCNLCIYATFVSMQPLYLCNLCIYATFVSMHESTIPPYTLYCFVGCRLPGFQWQDLIVDAIWLRRGPWRLQSGERVWCKVMAGFSRTSHHRQKIQYLKTRNMLIIVASHPDFGGTNPITWPKLQVKNG